MSRLSKWVAPLVLFLYVSSAMAQSSSMPPPPAALSANVEFVLVPTVVTAENGKHVADLKAGDFVLTQDGRRKPHIAYCEEVTHTSQMAPQLAPLPAGVFSNITSEPADAARPKNLVVIAIDAINTPFADQANARAAVLKYLSESVTSDSLVALLLMTPSGVKMLHDFTADPATLVAALHAVVTGNRKSGTHLAFPKAANVTGVESETAKLAKFDLDGYVVAAASRNEIDQAHQVDVMDTTASLIEISNIYAGVPGRKALVWITAGVPASLSSALLNPSLKGVIPESDMSAYFERAWKALNDANFAVYAIDATGLLASTAYGVGAASGQDNWYGSTQQQHTMSQNDTTQWFVHGEAFGTMQMLSKMTGGRAYWNSNDLAKGIRTAINDSDSYYMLGFYLDKNAKAGWHSLKVNVARKNVSVHSRAGFIVQKVSASSANQAIADLMLAMRSPVQFSALALKLSWQPAAALRLLPASASTQLHPPLPTDSRKRTPFQLVLASDTIQVNQAASAEIQVEILGVAQNDAGDIVATLHQRIQQKVSLEEATTIRRKGLLYNGGFDLPLGSYTVHLAVRDNLTGRLGSVITPLKVE